MTSDVLDLISKPFFPANKCFRRRDRAYFLLYSIDTDASNKQFSLIKSLNLHRTEHQKDNVGYSQSS